MEQRGGTAVPTCPVDGVTGEPRRSWRYLARSGYGGARAAAVLEVVLGEPVFIAPVRGRDFRQRGS